ncbi:MAG: DUF2845 domain-containing protein, partial [Candidatus Competibacteraceae bacterium]|nr:DUF2845 domain-containing protein [Candidatus Competibacteraceae bacterium]
QARYRYKRATTWSGYMVYLTETCEDDEIQLRGSGIRLRGFVNSIRPFFLGEASMSNAIWLGILLLLLGSVQPALALRCGTDLVLEGDHKVEVLATCGEPEYRDRFVIYQRVPELGHHREEELLVPVQVEEWVYNFGPHRFMRRLLFHDGRLFKIETLSYGH